MSAQSRLSWVLLSLRLSVFVVMLMWTLDKFVRPAHTAAVYENFYHISGLGSNAFYALGAAELALLLAFLVGAWKRLTYGLVFVLHAVSTLSTYRGYLAPFEDPNLLFFAAWPMLAACGALYVLRADDTLGTIGGLRQAA